MLCLGKHKMIPQSEELNKLYWTGFQKSSGPPIRDRFLREVQFLFSNPKWRECNSATMQIP